MSVCNVYYAMMMFVGHMVAPDKPYQIETVTHEDPKNYKEKTYGVRASTQVWHTL